jgi:hypothetical protein
MEGLRDLEEEDIKILNHKIHLAIAIGKLKFTLDENNNLVGIGFFNNGTDAIGPDKNCLLGWDDFIEHS